MARGKIIVNDRGYNKWLRALRRTARDPVIVTVGVHKEEGSQIHPNSKSTNVAVVAATHEFGYGNVPERSWLRSVIDSNKNRIEREMRSTMQRRRKAHVTGHLVAQAKRLGRDLRDLVLAKIDSNIPPPLAASTVANKGHDLALIETRTFRESITSKVRSKGTGHVLKGGRSRFRRL